MSTVARIFIAAAACPTLGALVGQDLARTVGRAANVATGVLARWEMIGLLAGICAGVLYALLTVYSVVACGERVRTRIADPIVLTLGALGVAELLVHRSALPPVLASTVRGATVLVWSLGLLFVLLAVAYAPRRRAVPGPEPEPDESRIVDPLDGARSAALREMRRAADQYEEDEDG